MSSEPHKRLPLLLACMVIIWGASQLNSETSLQRQFYQPETRLEGGIVVNGGFLQAITPLTIYRYKVLGVGVDSEKHKEIIERILFCESSNRHEGVWGDLNYKHHAYGIAQFYKSLACFIYQCSEGEVPETELYKMLEEAQDKLAYKIAMDWANEQGAEWC